jgi:pyridoxal phosphate enzyme (YggS family)
MIAEVDVQTVKANLQYIEDRIAAACARAGRRDDPRLLAATKYLPSQQMGALATAGIRLVGENRADELLEKWRRWNGVFDFHFIGHLQSRKVKAVLPCVSLVHSVDSLGLVEELQKRAENPIDVLLEVNVSGEESKYGILPAGAEAFLTQALAYPKVRFAGLMTMAPFADDPEEARPVFRALRGLRDHLVNLFNGRHKLMELSMGMSNDYEVAVEEGATIIRVGSALFSKA